MAVSKRLMSSVNWWNESASGATHESFCLLTNTVQYVISLYTSLVSAPAPLHTNHSSSITNY